MEGGTYVADDEHEGDGADREKSRLWVVGTKHVGGEWQCNEDTQLAFVKHKGHHKNRDPNK